MIQRLGTDRCVAPGEQPSGAPQPSAAQPAPPDTFERQAHTRHSFDLVGAICLTGGGGLSAAAIGAIVACPQLALVGASVALGAALIAAVTSP